MTHTDLSIITMPLTDQKARKQNSLSIKMHPLEPIHGYRSCLVGQKTSPFTSNQVSQDRRETRAMISSREVLVRGDRKKSRLDALDNLYDHIEIIAGRNLGLRTDDFSDDECDGVLDNDEGSHGAGGKSGGLQAPVGAGGKSGGPQVLVGAGAKGDSKLSQQGLDDPPKKRKTTGHAKDGDLPEPLNVVRVFGSALKEAKEKEMTTFASERHAPAPVEMVAGRRRPKAKKNRGEQAGDHWGPQNE
jgi:hypothetical protein